MALVQYILINFLFLRQSQAKLGIWKIRWPSRKAHSPNQRVTRKRKSNQRKCKQI